MPSWDEVRPILVAAYEQMDNSPGGIIEEDALAEALGRSTNDPKWERDLRALADGGYLDVQFLFSGPSPIDGTTRGRQEVQGWPGTRSDTSSAELLMRLLEELASAPDTPEQTRGKLRAVVAAMRETTIEVLARATGEVVARSTGMP